MTAIDSPLTKETGQLGSSTGVGTPIAPSDAWPPELLHSRQFALDKCQGQIDYFDDQAKAAYIFLRLSQVLTVVVSAVIPVLLLADTTQLSFLEPDIEPKRRLIAAMLSAFVAILTGLNAAFKWQEQWVRSATARETLTSERNLFETRADPEYAGDFQQAISTFMLRTEGLRKSDSGEWKAYELSTIPQWTQIEDRVNARLEELVKTQVADKNQEEMGKSGAD